MADDWIKIRTDLTDDPNVFILSEILSIECPTVVGHLVTFWGWMDRHTPDGTGLKLTKGVIDKRVGCDGFADALIEIGWLVGENMDFSLPKFERHNGASAKARALEAEAKRIRRSAKTDLENVGQVSDKKQAKSPTREEKRREDINITSTAEAEDSSQSNSDQPQKPPGSKSAPDCPHQKIIDLYHQHCPTMRQVKIWNGERTKILQARWRENPKHQSLEFWAKFFQYANSSDFLRGDSGKFAADLEWLVRPSNFAKVIEGKYENQGIA